MEAIGKGLSLDRLLNNAPSGAATLSLARSRISLSRPEVLELGALMVRVQTTYPGQEITPEAAALMREDWTEIALERGLAVLKEAVALHRRSSKFLPCRADLEQQVQVVLERRRSMRDEDDAQRFLREMREARQVWEQERSER